MAVSSHPSKSFVHFNRLPYEIQLRIVKIALRVDVKDYLMLEDNVGQLRLDFSLSSLPRRRESLKQIRCMSRVFCDIVTPALFASMHISASTASIKRAQSIAASHLAHHVNELVYHDCNLVNAHMDADDFQARLDEIRYSIQALGLGAVLDEQASHPYQNYLRLVQDAQDFRGWQRNELQQVTNGCPNMVTFTMLSVLGNESSRSPPSQYVLRTTGLLAATKWSSCHHSTLMFLREFSYFRPKYLKIDLFAVKLILKSHLIPSGAMDDSEIHHVFQAQFEQLKHLILDLRNLGPHVFLDSDPRYAARHRILWRCLGHNVRHLLLDSFHDNNPHHIVVKPYLEFPRLERLSVGNGKYISDSLIQVVKQVGKTLLHLDFQGPHICNSLIEALWQISKYTRLETCTGAETITDRKSNFNVRRTQPPHYPSKAVLIDKMVEALLHEREWPWWFGADEDDIVDSKCLPATTKAQRWHDLISMPWASTLDVFEGY